MINRLKQVTKDEFYNSSFYNSKRASICTLPYEPLTVWLKHGRNIVGKTISDGNGNRKYYLHESNQELLKSEGK